MNADCWPTLSHIKIMSQIPDLVNLKTISWLHSTLQHWNHIKHKFLKSQKKSKRNKNPVLNLPLNDKIKDFNIGYTFLNLFASSSFPKNLRELPIPRLWRTHSSITTLHSQMKFLIRFTININQLYKGYCMNKTIKFKDFWVK